MEFRGVSFFRAPLILSRANAIVMCNDYYACARMCFTESMYEQTWAEIRVPQVRTTVQDDFTRASSFAATRAHKAAVVNG